MAVSSTPSSLLTPASAGHPPSGAVVPSPVPAADSAELDLDDPVQFETWKNGLVRRNMSALIAIVEGVGDVKARVAASAELNKMLGVGTSAPKTTSSRRLLQLSSPSQGPSSATSSLLRRLQSPVTGTGAGDESTPSPEAMRAADMLETFQVLEEIIDEEVG